MQSQDCPGSGPSPPVTPVCARGRLPACSTTLRGTMRVSLFITCLTDTFYPQVGVATVELLEHLGCQVDFPRDQTCCGQPMFNVGFMPQARELAHRMVDVFEDSEAVVSPSGSCVAMIRAHYPELLQEEPMASRVAALAAKTFELSEFLLNVLDVDVPSLGVRWPGHATYHYSCHLRDIGVTDEVARILGGVEDLRYTPLEDYERCCGFGGAFAVKYPEVSGAMVRDKVAAIEATGAPTVVCNDAGCAMNISGACRRQGVDVRLVHVAELLAEGLGLVP